MTIVPRPCARFEILCDARSQALCSVCARHPRGVLVYSGFLQQCVQTVQTGVQTVGRRVQTVQTKIKKIRLYTLFSSLIVCTVCTRLPTVCTPVCTGLYSSYEKYIGFTNMCPSSYEKYIGFTNMCPYTPQYIQDSMACRPHSLKKS